MARKTHTLTITVSAPGWLTRRQVIKEVRTNINDHSAWGTRDQRDVLYRLHEEIALGDIKVRSAS